MSLTMPIRPAILPSALDGQPNGDVDESLLAQVDIRTTLIWLMAELPARGMRALHAAAANAGIILDSTGRGRTLAQQKLLFLSRYTTTPLPGRPTKVWNGQTWYQKPGTAMAAVPGTSNHGMWCADDLAEIVNGALVALHSHTVEWLYRHELDYGFSHETTSEAWHVHWYMGDVVPVAVLAYEASLHPVPHPPPLEDDMALPIITNKEPGLAAPGVVKFALMDDGKLRHLDEDEWRARGAVEGTPWTNAQISKAGTYGG